MLRRFKNPAAFSATWSTCAIVGIAAIPADESIALSQRERSDQQRAYGSTIMMRSGSSRREIFRLISRIQGRIEVHDMRRMTLAGLLFCCWAGTADLGWAQSPLQDFQKKVDDALPKGRLLRKLRDDLRGSKERDEKEKEKEAENRAKEERRANERDNRRNPPGLQPTPAQRPPQANFSDTGFSNTDATGAGFAPRDFGERESLAEKSNSARTSRDRRDAPVGFGLTLDTRGEQLIVSEVDRSGNAFQAGLRPGDVLEQVGGVPIRGLAEFDEVAGVLKPGDQIEMVYARKGKSARATVGFGQAPAGAEGSSEPAPAFAPGTNNTPNWALNNQPSRTPANDFAPPAWNPPAGNMSSATDANLRSVMDLDKQLSSEAGRSINPAEAAEWQRLIREQQQTIERLQRELDALRKSNSSRNRSTDPPLGI